MNRLAEATSPYLLQHADNPVDWYPWGEEALELARAEDRPILLSIGYAACHWCHVMEHESFEDAATARLMNEHFVCVKVDREERPDLDALYMEAVVALSGHGGWPMTVFLTPEGEPFFGGTYYPPEPRHGLPGFRQLLLAVAEAYRERRGDVGRQAQALVEALGASARARPSLEPLSEAVVSGAVRALARTVDPRWGGWGGAPKFPPHATLELLLRFHRRTGDEQALTMATATLDGMAAGGMHDLVGGGFHRYSVDDRWLVPHFEKMLYDNALLASAYLHGWAVTGEERYREISERTLEYALRELRLPGGALASSQDADTDGVEGLTFTWTPEELAAVLGADRSDLLQPFEHGRFVVRGDLSADERTRLLAAREERPQPARDDKAIAAWNGFALAALAEAGRRLGRPDFLAAAEELAAFLLGPLSLPDGRLARSERGGVTSGPGYLEDYAAVAHGLYELHLASGDLRRLEDSRRLALLAVDLFADEERGGFFLTAANGEPLVARPKELDDNPTPSGASLLSEVLLRLARLWGDDELERRAVSHLRLVRDLVPRSPQGFAYALCALDLHLSPPRELALVGTPEAAVARAALEPYDPAAVAAWSRGTDDAAAQRVPLLAGKGLVDGRPAVYVCEHFTCRAPATEPEQLRDHEGDG